MCVHGDKKQEERDWVSADHMEAFYKLGIKRRQTIFFVKHNGQNMFNIV